MYGNDSTHERVQMMIEFAPTIKQLYSSDVGVVITDKERVIYQLDSKVLDLGDSRGDLLTKEMPIYEVVKHNRRVEVSVGKEAYGNAFRTFMAPIRDEAGDAIGAIAITTSLDNQSNLQGVAEHLAASSQEISASTTEMASSADEMKIQMKNLIAACDDMNNKVKETEKILELINNIALSTRMLGLNAGIEAARSGEHGKGFSVVAQEIGKLSVNSQHSVDQIIGLLKDVDDQVKYVLETVEKTAVISDQQSTATNEISDAILALANVAGDVEELAQKL